MGLASQVNHVVLLFLVHAGHSSVVLHADQESSAVGVGKGHERTRDFGGIVDAHFEVLGLVLPFLDHLLHVGHGQRS